MMRFSSAAALAIALCSPVLAEGTANTAEQTAPAPKPKKICRLADESSTGRIGTGRTCKTVEQWAEIDAAGRRTGSRSVVSRSSQGN